MNTANNRDCEGELARAHAFAIGDEVDFRIETRTPPAALADMLGTELFATVDAMESHRRSLEGWLVDVQEHA